MSYVLLDKSGKTVNKFNSSCYTEALTDALGSLGYIVEAVDDFPAMKKSPVVTPPKEVEVEIVTTSSVGPSLTHPPFTGKALEIFKMIVAKPCTLEEIIAKTGVAQSTAKQVVTYHFKLKGYIVKQTAAPGVQGIMYNLT